MKLLLENWREYLNENAFGVQGFKKLPQAARLSVNFKNRIVVIVDVPDHGPTAFYRSSGTGTPELGTENMWLPMGGVGARYSRTTGKRDLWLIKFEGSGKVPPKGHPMHEVGVRLGAAYDKKPFPETKIESFASGLQIPTAGEVSAMESALFNKCRDDVAKQLGYSDMAAFRQKFGTPGPEEERNQLRQQSTQIRDKCKQQQQAQMLPDAREWEAIIINRWFNGTKALKKEWADAAMTTDGDYFPGGSKDPKGNIKQIMARIQQAKQGSQQ
jgi:hypothetical protein